MEYQPNSNENENQTIKYSTTLHQGSKWKTGLSRFKSNVSKPTLCSLPAKNQEKELNHQKIVVVDIDEGGAQNPSPQKAQTNHHHSKNTQHQSSSTNYSNQTQQLYLPSSLFDNKSIISNNDDFLNNDKKVHFNTEESSNNDFFPIQPPNINNNRPKTQIKNINNTHLPIDHIVKYNKAKSQPLYHNQYKSAIKPYNEVHKSFDAHFKRQKEAIEAFKKRDWLVSERMYKMKCQKIHQIMNWKEFNPEAKVTSFKDNYVTEEVHEEAKRERRLNDLPDDSSVVDGKFKLPPDRQLTGCRCDRVFFWG